MRVPFRSWSAALMSLSCLSSFFGPFSVPLVVTAFTLQKALRLRNVPFFDFCSPGLGLRVLAFAVWACFPPGWNGGFHLWRLPGESLG